MNLQSLAMTLALLASVCGAAAAHAADAATAVPVRRVMLFSSGVGYFEHAGTVTGTARTELRFKTEQVNDLLKSLVLEDQDGGTIASVEYPSSDPLEKTLASFQINIGDNPPLPTLLGRMRGSRVRVTAPGRALAGHVLGVEAHRSVLPDGKTVSEQWQLNLMSDDHLTAIDLADVQELQLEDPALQAELLQALSTLAHARDHDTKPLTVHFAGQGQRRVRLAYVVETPLWKSSYRLLLPDDGDQAHLQGWAIVDNQTDSDWNAIELGLISGRPISFMQDLYQPLYVPRPVVRPELYSSLDPQADQGGIPLGGEVVSASAPDADAWFSEFGLAQPKRRPALIAPAPAPPPIDPSQGVRSSAAAADLGELFSYTVQAVTLPRQRSAMIPIVTAATTIERISVYNESQLARHPLNGVRLTNTTDNHLLQGPITVFDGGGYAGDARLDDLPPSQQRLLTYAVDLDITVGVESDRVPRRILDGRIVRGVLESRAKDVLQRVYSISNNDDRDRRLIIEHPRNAGWTLTQPATALETTDTHYRFEHAAAAGRSAQVTVTEERVVRESLALIEANLAGLEHIADGPFAPEVRAALAGILGEKRDIAALTDTIARSQAAIRAIAADQGRMRDNMAQVDDKTDYYRRLLKKLDDQETEVETLQAQIVDLEARRAEQQQRLEDRIANLSID